MPDEMPRAHAPALPEHMPGSNATDGRTDGLTESSGHRAEETSPFVTRGRAYGSTSHHRRDEWHRPPTRDELAELRRLAREGAQRIHAATVETKPQSTPAEELARARARADREVQS